MKACSVCAVELVPGKSTGGMCMRCYERDRRRKLAAAGVCRSCAKAAAVVGRGGRCGLCADRKLAQMAERRKCLADLGLPNPQSMADARLRAEAKAAGTCVYCRFHPANGGKTSCAECRIKARASRSSQYRFRKENGLCVTCAQPAEMKRTQCRPCLDKASDRKRMYKQPKKEA